ncbi:hypothetical protein M569_00344, partial [Genlisea aurea]
RRRRLMGEDDDEKEEKKQPIVKKKVSSDSISLSIKNQTKIIASSSSFSLKTNNQTRISKPTFDSSKNATKKNLGLLDNPETTIKTKKKLNSTAKSTTLFTEKSSDLPLPKKLTLPRNSTTNGKDTVKAALSENGQRFNKSQTKKAAQKKNANLIDEDDDLVAEFSSLPAKFQETIVPDLEKISKTSKSYLTKYNKQFARGFQPYVGNKYAPRIASLVSFAFIVIPLILVSLVFNRIKAYFSLQKILIFVQIYLAIYFSILCLSSLATGLEPVRFFYSTSQSTYVCVQVLQTLSYVLYLLLLLMYLVLVFSADTPAVTKLLGLVQAFVGFSVGLHYYVTVFHRAIMRQPPKTSWKVHAVYATCFVVICLLGRFDRKKKAYLEDGGQQGKEN